MAKDSESYPPVVVGTGQPQETYGYPPPTGYPPQPGGYPPQPGGYPPPTGYPPQPGTYPPQPGAYPPQAGGYPAYAVQPGAVMIQTAPYASNPNYSEIPIKFKCPHCSHDDFTKVKKKTGTGTWVMCMCLCVFGFFPFNYVPFCLDPCKDTWHYCEKCGNPVGVRPLFGVPPSQFTQVED